MKVRVLNCATIGLPFSHVDFDAFPVLDRPALQVLLVPLPGHTRGHCGVAVGDGSQWILHCGDGVAMRALETRPGSIAARPLGPRFLKLHALAQAQAGRIRLMPAHVRVEDMPELANAGEFAAETDKRVGGEGELIPERRRLTPQR